MKTVTLIISSLFLLMTFAVSAQHPGAQQRGPRTQMNPEEMIKKSVERMKAELKLDEKQEKQIKELLTESFKQRGELMKKYHGQRDSMMVYGKKMEEQQNLSLKKILNADQYKTYITNLEKRKQEMEKYRKEAMDKRKEGKAQGGNPAVVEEGHDCTGCGGCGDKK